MPIKALIPSTTVWLQCAWFVQPANTFFKQRGTKTTQFQPAQSMNQNIMEKPNLLLGSVNAECLQDWALKGSTQQSHSVLAPCLPLSEMQRIRLLVSALLLIYVPLTAEGWDIHSGKYSCLKCIPSCSPPQPRLAIFVIQWKIKIPPYLICLLEGWIVWEHQLSGKTGKEREPQPGWTSLPW